jgi:hypothetical protein
MHFSPTIKAVLSFGICAALLVALFISPLTATALNTYSIDLEKDSNQYLSVADSAALSITGDITVEAWIKAESMEDGTSQYIAAKGTTGSYNAWRLMSSWNSATSKHNLSFTIDETGSNTVAVAYAHADVDLGAYVGTWIHVAATWDATSGSAAPKVYVNGSEVSSYSSQGNDGGTDAIADTNSSTYIGNSPNQTLYFDGVIDDVRVWSVVRTGTEINDDKSRELNGNEAGLAAYWKLNNGLTDTTANGNTLTNNNSATFAADIPFDGFTLSLSTRKSVNESLSGSIVLQNDDHLKLSLAANKTYVIDGVVFASSTSATPDIQISFFGQTDSTITVGYTNDINEMVLESGQTSSRINLPANTPTSIHVKGTVKTGGTSGDFQLKWSQVTSSSAFTTVMAGSYLKAEEI